MTKKELATYIDLAKLDGIYIPLTHYPTYATIKNIISQCLETISESETIDVYCSKKGKLIFMEKFWIDDFNYLGTRIRIIQDDLFENTEYSTIPLMGEKKNFLFLCDGMAVCYIETVC